MKTVALISGGKDSCFNMMCCVAEGHEIVALANLRPEKEEMQELDSYMFQTVGHTAIDLYAEAMGLPLYVQTISGTSLATDCNYRPQEGDEVEDLYKLLQAVKDDITIEAVSVGAILSDYQRVRVENVCGRLGLTVLSYLWRRDQHELLEEMIHCGVKAKIIKVAAMGLRPHEHLGLGLSQILPHMLKMKSKYGLNVCGEGGEYETFVFDCPLFQQKIQLDRTEVVIHSDDAFAPVGYLVLKSCSLCPKPGWDASTPLKDQLLKLPLLTNQRWLEKRGVTASCPNVDGAGGGGVDAQGELANSKAMGDFSLPSMVMCVPDVGLSGTEPPVFSSDGTNFQVSGIRALQDRDVDLAQSTELALNHLKECLSDHNVKMEDLISVSLSVGDMSNFAAINSLYKKFFDLNPPVRVCVEANLPRNILLQLDSHGKHPAATTDSESDEETRDNVRKVLHVQGLSHWAPANIGPYSQAVLSGDKLFLAGIVPLVPANLNVVEGGFDAQCSLALLHVQSVMSAIAPGCLLRNCPLVTCYLTKSNFIERARQGWERALKANLSNQEDDVSSSVEPGLTPHVQYVQVSALPKACLVEWHVTGWTNMEDSRIRVVREWRQVENYSLCAVAQSCEDRPHLFSCSIRLDTKDARNISRQEKQMLPGKLLDLYCHVWCQSGATSTPMAKLFFSPTLYDYTIIHKYFSEAVANVCSQYSVPTPVVSLIPISGLDSREQLLAWCQV